MRVVTVLIAVSMTAASADLVQAQQAGAEARAEAAAQMQTPEARLEAAIDVAMEAGIPASLLQSKIAEGRAKGVAEARIAAAVEARLQGLLKASEALERARVSAVSAADIAVTADALEAGVDASVVAQVASSASEERRAVAIAVLADLVQLGLASDVAFARVNTAIAEGPQALANLRAETAASMRARGLRSSDGVGIDARAGAGARIN